MKLLKLTEANLNRISKGREKGGYCILSACRDIFTPDENNVRTNELKNLLKTKHYSYIMVYGRFNEEGTNRFQVEKSFIVYPFDIVTKEVADWEIFEKDLTSIAKKYEQDSILICRPGDKPFYKGLKPGIKDLKKFSSVKLNDVTQEYFTALKKWSDLSLNKKNHDWNEGNPQRFTFESFEDEDDISELFLEPYPTTLFYSHMKYLERDMNHIYLVFEEYKSMFNDDSYFDWEE